MLHPELNDIINMSAITDFTMELDDGVYKIIRKKDVEKLSGFLQALEDYRHQKNEYIVARDEFPNLPYVTGKHAAFWKLRQYDLEIINQLLHGKSGQQIFDIGSWNGWLSNSLSAQGHQVVAIDYFLHELDGLKAKKHYPNEWLAIQMDTDDLHIFSKKFDLIVVNRCFAYFSDPLKKAEQLAHLLNPGGKILLTGLFFYRNENKLLRELRRRQEDFMSKYGFPLFYKETRGYLNMEDKTKMRAAGFQLSPYRKLWKANLKALLIPSSPAYYYGVKG